MLNIEEYKEELSELGVNFALNEDIQLTTCEDTICEDCEFGKGDKNCGIVKMKWLLEGYTEPVLTEEEKIIIKDIIKASEPFNKKPVYISKIEYFSTVGECYLEIKYEDDRTSTPNFKYDELFKGMELRKEYTLEDLGL